MSAKRILLLFVAIFAGGIAAFLAVSGQKAPAVVAQIAQVQEISTKVLVTKSKIGLGHRITSEDIAWQKWPEEALRPEYITIERLPNALTDLVGVVVRFEMFAGEPVREERIVRTNQGYLSAVIGKGLRAVSIRISPESGAGGFIVPNDRVDILLTSSTNQGERTETILENVRVLAIGLRLGETGDDDKGGQNTGTISQPFDQKTTATVELAPSQAEDIINAEKLGSLALALRSVADFADQAETVKARDENANQVKLIKFGQEENLIIVGAGVVDESLPHSHDDEPSVEAALFSAANVTSNAAGNAAGAAYAELKASIPAFSANNVSAPPVSAMPPPPQIQPE